MAFASHTLVSLLERTAERLEAGADYSWSHMGRCNCGHLAQTITQLAPAEIHRRALRAHAHDWTEISEHPPQFCGATGASFDHILDALHEMGLSGSDIGNLEKLADTKVLRALPGGFTWLKRNQREDLVLYLKTWAGLLRQELDEEGERCRGFEVEEKHQRPPSEERALSPA